MAALGEYDGPRPDSDTANEHATSQQETDDKDDKDHELVCDPGGGGSQSVFVSAGQWKKFISKSVSRNQDHS